MDLTEWHRGVRETLRDDPREHLQAVTDYVHLRVGYLDDPEDIWQLPLDTLSLHTGDCEDYAFAKYALLRAGGWPPDRLRLGYGRTTALGKSMAHLVALAYLLESADPVVLDNLGDLPKLASERSDLVLAFSFDESRVYDGALLTAPPKAARLRKWDEYLPRLRASGVLDAPPI